MQSRPEQRHSTPTPVRMAFVLEAQPSRTAAFKTSCAALLHAGFNFGRSYPGRIMYSHDAAAENYGAPVCVPAGSVASMSDAVKQFDRVAPYYNRSVSLGFDYDNSVVPVTCRTYDDADWMTITLDFEDASWRRLVAHFHSTRGATSTLVDVGKTLFTLVPVTYLLIGPAPALVDLPRMPSAQHLCKTPIAMIAHRGTDGATPDTNGAAIEQLPRGSVVVRQWNAGAPVQFRPRARRTSSRPSRASEATRSR